MMITTTTPISDEVKRAVVKAATNHGADGHGRRGLVGYLEWLATRHPDAFAKLLSNVLPPKPRAPR